MRNKPNEVDGVRMVRPEYTQSHEQRLKSQRGDVLNSLVHLRIVRELPDMSESGKTAPPQSTYQPIVIILGLIV